MSQALEEAFGRPTTTEGQGGSIPLCNVLHDTFPDAEIMLLGVEEPRCLIHAPNESVDPQEIERMAVAEALFLRGYGQTSPGCDTEARRTYKDVERRAWPGCLGPRHQERQKKWSYT